MKQLIVCALSLMALAACGNSGSSKGGGGGASAQSAEPGHQYSQQCPQSLVEDLSAVNSDCMQAGYDSGQCTAENQALSAKYPNMQCSYDDGGTKLDYSDSHS